MKLPFATCLFSLLLPAIVSAQSTQPAWQTLPQGQLMLRPFAHAPYPHASRDNGWKYHDQVFSKEQSYSDSTVGIFIPNDFVPGPTVDYVVHFHGWGNHVANVIPEYKLAEQLLAAHVNAILLVPQGPKDASDSGGGKLELDPDAFAKLIGELTDYLKAEGKIPTTQVGHIAISTHSGGYKVTAAILDHGGMGDHITDVLLLDSSYGSLPWFVNWAGASPQHRLISTFTDHLADTNKEFMGLLDAAKVKYQSLDESTLTDAQLAARGVTFFHTVGPHNDVPIMYFGRFVAGADLPKVPTTQPAK